MADDPELKHGVIKPDQNLVELARQSDLSLVDFYKVEDEKTDWGVITNNFVVQQGASKRIRFFIKKMHDAKMLTERKMRFDLDIKVQAMRIEKLS